MVGKNFPVHRISVGGIQVAIWENESKEGKTFNTVTLDRRYKVGEEWKSTNSFKVNDLPKASLALQKAFEYLSLKETGAQAAQELV
ncbi:MAG: hypothetical protein HYW50_05195 [Candidatus Diapherotrites archaeon]|nr:hypothetical protein [Candidatus Diapherotrites archaeon]